MMALSICASAKMIKKMAMEHSTTLNFLLGKRRRYRSKIENLIVVDAGVYRTAVANAVCVKRIGSSIKMACFPMPIVTTDFGHSKQVEQVITCFGKKDLHTQHPAAKADVKNYEALTLETRFAKGHGT